MTMLTKCDNVKGIAHSDKPTENYLKLNIPMALRIVSADCAGKFVSFFPQYVLRLDF